MMPQNIVSQWIEYFETVVRTREISRNKELNLTESHANQPVIKSFPNRCYLEVTNQCNLRCHMCGQSWFEGKRSYIPDEILEKVKELYPYMDEISVFGFGESLVDKRFFDILAMIPRRIQTRYVSNGILMNRDAAEKMIELELKDLNISIDAACEETFVFVRAQKGFERIINNIKTLMELKKQKNAEYPRLTMCYTFFRRNAEEFLRFIELAHSLGVKRVSGDYLIVYRNELVNESLYFDQELGNRVFKQARELADKLGVELFLPSSFEEAHKKEHSGEMLMCYEPWEFVYFRSDGLVQPCCVNDLSLGDLRKQSFNEIWNSQAYQDFRKMVNTTRSNLNCAQCMGRGMRKITDKSFHIKILDKEGNVLGPEPVFESTLSVGSGTVTV
jgi:radical SAM protein with 4Fe4S-binding SPASM domain